MQCLEKGGAGEPPLLSLLARPCWCGSGIDAYVPSLLEFFLQPLQNIFRVYVLSQYLSQKGRF
jgi:hypothetical protein